MPFPGVEQYQVGWVCALPKEMATARAMLDEEHGPVLGQDARDHNNYVLGRMHDHNVVIACLPAGVDGNNAAATVAANMLRSFGGLRFGLMVGIGGGIPNLDKGVDIRLGDVVVSQPDKTHGGVVQFDKGKSLEGGQFERKGSLNKPPPLLLAALASLQAQHEMRGSQMSAYLANMIKNNPMMEENGYTFPGVGEDCLHCAHCKPTLSNSCDYCQGGTVRRKERRHTRPIIHYGTIASGNQVVKDSAVRDRLSADFDAKCVEMEAAGLMDDFPCMVIRGVCDYADAYKNDAWHRYAASTAAAYAKEFLSVLPPNDVSEVPHAADVMKELERTNKSLSQIKVKLDLNKLPYAKGAMFNSYDQDHTTCHPATRVELLRQIQDWASRTDSKSIFWLSGMAGTGKSTISWTMAKWLSDQRGQGGVDLGASFFFKRNDGDRGNASRFFPTLIRELVLKIPGMGRLVADVITSDPFIFNKALGEQFNKLIFEPLQQVRATASRSPTLIVVVDALDECEKERDIKTIIDLWSRIPDVTAVRLRLFLTSRPDLPVQLGFKNMSVSAHRDMVLQDEVPRTTIQHDIFVFLEDKFEKIRTQYNLDPPLGNALDRDWPGTEILHALVNMAIPLFIVAVTVCRFVEDSYWKPQERLKTILQFPGIGEMEQMEQTYLPVLTQMTANLKNLRSRDSLYQEFRTIVGSIINLAEPLSTMSLATLLSLPVDDIVLRLRPLQSVLRVASDTETPIHTLHLSFGEFLLSDKVQNLPFRVNGPKCHLMLRRRCLELLSSPEGLRENICDLTYPGQPRQEVDSALINRCLSPALQYACQYWVHHAQHSMTPIDDNDQVYTFLQKHFLHWLEVFSLMNRISEVIGQLHVLQLLLSPTNCTHLSHFLEDARRIVLANRYIVDLAPLQIYSSAMMFAPQTSIVRKTCGQIPSWVQTLPITPATWGPELQQLEGHTGRVSAVAFSPNGSLLASASWDRTVRLWKPSTGQEVQRLEGHTEGVNAVAFSPNGSLLASASWDRTVRLWKPSTGQEVQRLEGHTEGVSAVAFSPNGSLLASASWDRTVRLWKPSTGQEVQRLEGHTREVNAVAFSPNGSLLALASGDGTVRLWKPSMGQEVQRLGGHTGRVSAVAFSPNGSLLASASWDRTVRLWKPSTGQEVQRLEGHTEGVSAVAFSPNGSLLASASGDETVRLWKPSTGQEVQRLEGHTEGVNAVAFSPNGSLLASASGDETVRLWKPSTGQEVQRLEGHTEGVSAVAFSPNGSLLASASWDRTVRLWKPSTGQEVQRLEGHTEGVSAVAFSPNGSLLASASWDRTVRLWKPSTGQEVQRLEGHTEGVIAVAFSPNGSLLASASGDRTIRLWKPSTGQEMEKFEIMQSTYLLSFSFDSKTILTNRGAMHVNNRFISNNQDTSTTYDFFTKNTVMMNDSWVQQGRRNLLWLPHEYRGRCTDVHGNMLALGQHSGHVSFVQLDYP